MEKFKNYVFEKGKLAYILKGGFYVQSKWNETN